MPKPRPKQPSGPHGLSLAWPRVREKLPGGGLGLPQKKEKKKAGKDGNLQEKEYTFLCSAKYPSPPSLYLSLPLSLSLEIISSTAFSFSSFAFLSSAFGCRLLFLLPPRLTPAAPVTSSSFSGPSSLRLSAVSVLPFRHVLPPIMEWVRELFATAVLAVLLSFAVAKLVSVAMAGGGGGGGDEPGSEEGVDRAPAVEDATFEARLSSHRESPSVEGVEFVQGTAGEVDRFGGEGASVEGGVGEPARRGEEVGTARAEAVEGSSVAAELPAEAKGEESVGASELAVEKESECRPGGPKEDGDRPSLEGEDEESQTHVPKSAETARAEQPEHEREQIDKEGEVLRVGSDDDDDDDDWEGIERSELEKKFALAANYVDPANMDDRMESVGGDVKMQLYGLHKVATEGPCREPQPMALMVSARAKWNAWQRLGNMSPDVAMERYISLLAENIPDWEVAKTTDENKSDVAMPGAQDCNLGTVSCDQLKCTNLREPSMASVTGQIDLSKDENP
ncbi:hypothetical protein NL676_024829 [Syzygium grande]|nr:hypothetical protein NL676_024829 [Syzygium grande]